MLNDFRGATAICALGLMIAAGCGGAPDTSGTKPREPATARDEPNPGEPVQQGAHEGASGDHAGQNGAQGQGSQQGGKDHSGNQGAQDHGGMKGHLLAFSSLVGEHFQLFVWDPASSESYAIPGAGEDVLMPMNFAKDRIVFDRGGKLYFYDLTREIVGTFNDINDLGELRHPSISDDGRVLGFHIHAPEPDERVGLWVDGTFVDPAKVNAVGADHRGTHMFTVGCDGRFAAFSTIDNGLYLYDIVNPAILEIVAARQVAPGEQMEHVALSQDGTQVAFAKGDRVYRFDRRVNQIDEMAYLNLAYNARRVQSPMFMCGDNAHLYAETVLANDQIRVVAYNWLTETLSTLSLLNNVLGEGTNLLSSGYSRD